MKRIWLWLVAGLLAASAVRTEAAGPLLFDSGPINRPTAHTALWCPSVLYASFTFVANGPEATLVFQAQTYGNDAQNPGLWLRQRIDDVAVVTSAVYAAHQGVIDNSRFFCMLNQTASVLQIQDVPAQDFAFFDKFDTAPNPDWDTSGGAYYVADDSGPNNIATHEDGTPDSGGSLGLGAQTGGPAFATASVLIGGLQAGVGYVVSFWWNGLSEGFDSQGDPIADGDLWVAVYGTDVTATEGTTWGALKRAYQDGQ